eukprot:927024-Prymnesium_polylepis.1
MARPRRARETTKGGHTFFHCAGAAPVRGGPSCRAREWRGRGGDRVCTLEHLECAWGSRLWAKEMGAAASRGRVYGRRGTRWLRRCVRAAGSAKQAEVWAERGESEAVAAAFASGGV